MIVVRALGACEIQIGRKRITLTTEVPLALAFYLTTRAGELLTRDELAETFWGSKDPAKARHSLRQTLYKLRQKGLEIDEGAEEIRLDAAQVDNDITRALAPEWPASATAEEVVRAQEVLPGLTRQMAAGFMEWLDALRSQVAAAHRRAALAQIARARREARWADLDVWARQVLRTDPLNEEATLARAESAAMAGSKAVALEILDGYMAELGENAPKIGLPASVLRRRIAERQPEWKPRGPRDVPLVGRAELMSRLTALVEDAAQGRGGGLMLWGAPGIGKTRLAMELASYAELSGFRVLSVRSNVADSGRPLSGILDLVPLLCALPGAVGAHPSTLRVLDRVQRAHTLEIEPGMSPTTLATNTDVVAALDDLLEAVSREVKLVVVFDDAHHLDSLSRAALPRIAVLSRKLRTLWVTTARPSTFDGRYGAAQMEGFRAIHVGPLDMSASLELIRRSVAESALPLEVGDSMRIAETAGGIPLFLRELSIHRVGDRGAEPLPSSIFDLIDDRLSTLTAPQLHLLRAIALLGSLATVTRLRRLLPAEHNRISESLGVLEEEGIVLLTADRRLALHECWQQVLEDRSAGTVMVALADEVAQVLLSPHEEGDAIEARWQAAELYLRAGSRYTAQGLFADVGDLYFLRGLLAESELAFKRARACTDSSATSLKLAARHVRSLAALDRLEEADNECRTILVNPTTRSDDDLHALAALRGLRVEICIRTKADHREALLDASRVAGDRRFPAAARIAVSFTGLIAAANDQSSPLEDQFYQWSEDACHDLQEKPTLALLISLIYAAERGKRALLTTSERALAERDGENQPDTFACRCLRVRAMAQRWLGKTAFSFALGRRALDLSNERGLVPDSAMACEMLTFTALDAGDESGIAEWMGRWITSQPARLSRERYHAFTHARARVLLRAGDYAAALECYHGVNAPTAWQFFEKRRATDSAAISLALAGVGSTTEAREALAECRRITNANRPSPHMDYVVETCAQAYALMGANTEAEEFVTTYLRRRSAATEFPIATGHRRLVDRAGRTVTPFALEKSL